MNEYRITWEIDLHANTPEEAARAARAIQLRADSMATVFEVTGADGTPHRIDLDEIDQEASATA